MKTAAINQNLCKNKKWINPALGMAAGLTAMVVTCRGIEAAEMSRGSSVNVPVEPTTLSELKTNIFAGQIDEMLKLLWEALRVEAELDGNVGTNERMSRWQSVASQFEVVSVREYIREHIDEARNQAKFLAEEMLFFERRLQDESHYWTEMYHGVTNLQERLMKDQCVAEDGKLDLSSACREWIGTYQKLIQLFNSTNRQLKQDAQYLIRVKKRLSVQRKLLQYAQEPYPNGVPTDEFLASSIASLPR